MAETLSEEEEREVARYEDLRIIANRAVFTIELQIPRLRDFEALKTDFVLQPVTDAEFLILALDRLVAVAGQIKKMSGTAVDEAITAFERSNPNLRKARNIIAHLDEYILGRGRDQTVSPGSVQICGLRSDTMEFAGLAFNLALAMRRSSEVFESIRSDPPESFRKAVRVQRAKKDS